MARLEMLTLNIARYEPQAWEVQFQFLFPAVFEAHDTLILIPLQFLKQLTHLIFAINHYYYLLKKCQALAQPHQVRAYNAALSLTAGSAGAAEGEGVLRGT